MKVASVLISNSTREFDKEYCYFVPDSLADGVKPGVRVIVPFGKSNKPVEAYVYSLLDSDSANDGFKKISKVVDDIPVLTREMLKLAEWMKNKYICTYSDAIKCMLPPGMGIKSVRIVKLLEYRQGLNPVSQKILDVLKDKNNECELDELKRLVNNRSFSKKLNEMAEAGAIALREEFSAGVREKIIRVAYIARPAEEIIEEIESDRLKKIQHVRVLELLLENQYIPVQDIVRFSSVSAGVLNTLKKYGYIDFKEIEVKRDPTANRTYERTYPLKPTPVQAAALEKIKPAIDEGRFREFLIHGVTGSGKTEVYLQLIQHCLEKGRQAIVLVPEISLTPQMVERFKGRFGDEVAVLHSRLSLGERYDQWRLIKEGNIKVAVGARSAVFAPFENLGIIIIDEEHENTYKSEITPKYHARDVARERCRNMDAVLVCGSATPSVESFYKAQIGQAELVEMAERANSLVMPRVEVVDMRKELEEGNRSVFSRKLAEEMLKNKQNGHQTILFLNRRGYASFMLCRQCGHAIRCVNCSISLTYHFRDERLICHYCGYTVKKPGTCPKCGSAYIRHFGTGTQKVEEEIKKQFPEFSVIRMDMDTTTYKNSHEEILKAFREEQIDVMIGTQMVAKGHDFPNVTLVGVLAADSLLNIEDFRAAERTFQLVTQVAGRAGRGETPGKVVIQTYNPDAFSITAACRHDYYEFYRQEIKIREMLFYPPFTNIAAVTLFGTNDRLVGAAAKEAKEKIEKLFKEKNVSVEVLGPSRTPIPRIKSKFRWRIVVKCKEEDMLIEVLGKFRDEFYKNKRKPAAELGIDINPSNMM